VKVLRNSHVESVIAVAQDWQGEGTAWHYWENNKQ